MKNISKLIYFFLVVIFFSNSYSMDREALAPLMEEGRAAQVSALMQARVSGHDRIRPLDELTAARATKDDGVRVISGAHLLFEATQSSSKKHLKAATKFAEKHARLKALGGRISAAGETSSKVSSSAARFCFVPICYLSTIVLLSLAYVVLNQSKLPTNCSNMTSCDLLNISKVNREGFCEIFGANFSEIISFASKVCCEYNCSGKLIKTGNFN